MLLTPGIMLGYCYYCPRFTHHIVFIRANFHFGFGL